MFVKQISAFLENKSGRLAEITEVIGRLGVDIRALSIADTTDFGILRLIVNKPDEVCAALRESGFTVRVTDVIAVSMSDAPGSLAGILSVLQKNGMGIEYLYAFVGNNDKKAVVVLRVDDNKKAVEILQKENIKVLAAEDVYNI